MEKKHTPAPAYRDEVLDVDSSEKRILSVELNTSELDVERNQSLGKTDKRRSRKQLALVVSLALLGYTVFSSFTKPQGLNTTYGCPDQPDPLVPPVLWELTDEEKAHSVDLFAQSVRIPTQSYDDNGEPGEDDRWAPFFDFQKWLRDSFPLAHEKGEIEYINTLGIIATFQGSDSSLKPIILMSHYDGVPAPDNTLDQWTHPPFSGFNDGTLIWGRASQDDKTLLVGQWEAVTRLLQDGWKPRRTLILSHGFDEEEVFARRGQGHIAPVLESRYPEGVLMIVDEGGGNDEFYGAPFAMPGMGEKGYLDLVITVSTPGGHSSVPPPHTGIGIMSEIVAAVESHPFEQKLTKHSPYLRALHCANQHAPSFPSSYAHLLRARKYTALARKLASTSLLEKAKLGTTVAVDVIRGGVKVNALPELVTAQVNFRIDFSESIESTKKHVAKVIEAVAKRKGLEFHAFDSKNGTIGRGVGVEVLGLPIEPAPLTPTSGGVWDLFAGTVRATTKDADGKPVIVAPSASTGNSDCKVYYNLTKNVFRYTGETRRTVMGGVHTVNEHASIEGHYQIVRWVHALVQNADRYDGPE